MLSRVPIVKDLVLVGGGHSHVEVVRNFGMKPMPGVRVTLVSKEVTTPYSGMLPGYVSGFYSFDDVHIDLQRLTAWAGVRLVCEEVTGLDLKGRRVLFRSRPSLGYDALSINIGIRPGAEQVPGASEHTTPVKPIAGFVTRLDQLLARASKAMEPLHVVVVGGGAGGVEIALAVQQRLKELTAAAGAHGTHDARVTLVCRGKVLGSHTSFARNSILSIMARKGVTVRENTSVMRVEHGSLVIQREGPQGLGPEEVLGFDECLWCTQAAAPAWLKETGLPTDKDGFLAIKPTLQSDGGPPEVFAAGDVASCAEYPRPKAGVFAVRQGPPLASNLRKLLAGQELEPFIPQSTFLSLISTGDRYCVGTKGWVGLQGSWLWWWKDSIDRAFMRKYGDDLPPMSASMKGAGGGMQGSGAGSGPEGVPPALAAAGPEALTLFAESKMRCGGCGAKVGASVLSRALGRLPPSVVGPAVIAGLATPDDAALIRPPGPGKLLVQSIDFFRSFWDDPYILGKIAANHALGDVWAMGGQPVSALALAAVPVMSEHLVEEDLVALMAGALEVLNAAGCSLVGGHTCEGSELGVGFSVTGEVEEERVMRKSGLKPGQALILTKSLGTGTIMAAAMRGKAKGQWVMGALDSMCAPSGKAAQVLASHGATGATDVTGFGLVGHLVEMARASGVHAQLDFSTLPVLEGAYACLARGVVSSLHTQNARASASIQGFEQVTQSLPSQWHILVDPQTAGGLLAGVPQEQAKAALQALHAAGCTQAAIIGHIAPPATDDPRPVSILLPKTA